MPRQIRASVAALDAADPSVHPAHPRPAWKADVLGAADPEAARRALEVRFGFTETQAWAVMDVQFRRLTLSDRNKIEQRRRELAARVAALEEGPVGD